MVESQISSVIRHSTVRSVIITLAQRWHQTLGWLVSIQMLKSIAFTRTSNEKVAMNKPEVDQTINLPHRTGLVCPISSISGPDGFQMNLCLARSRQQLTVE